MAVVSFLRQRPYRPGRRAKRAFGRRAVQKTVVPGEIFVPRRRARGRVASHRTLQHTHGFTRVLHRWSRLLGVACGHLGGGTQRPFTLGSPAPIGASEALVDQTEVGNRVVPVRAAGCPPALVVREVHALPRVPRPVEQHGVEEAAQLEVGGLRLVLLPLRRQDAAEHPRAQDDDVAGGEAGVHAGQLRQR